MNRHRPYCRVNGAAAGSRELPLPGSFLEEPERGHVAKSETFLRVSRFPASDTQTQMNCFGRHQTWRGYATQVSSGTASMGAIWGTWGRPDDFWVDNIELGFSTVSAGQ